MGDRFRAHRGLKAHRHLADADTHCGLNGGGGGRGRRRRHRRGDERRWLAGPRCAESRSSRSTDFAAPVAEGMHIQTLVLAKHRFRLAAVLPRLVVPLPPLTVSARRRLRADCLPSLASASSRSYPCSVCIVDSLIVLFGE